MTPQKSTDIVPRRRSVERDRLAGMLGGVALACSLIAGQAASDDTEIFFGQVDPTKRIHPNVLFVIDTSGSMNWGEVDGNAPKDDEPSRLDMLKTAMNDVLKTTTDVNVGLMRFNGYNGGGGAVLYPITPIDADVCADGGCGAVNVSSKVAAQSDNAEEQILRTDGNTYTDGNILSLGRTNGNDGRDQTIGLRFGNLDIPQGAVIQSAYIDFTARDNDGARGDGTEFQISVQASTDAAPYVNRENFGVTSRPLAPVMPVLWKPGQWIKATDRKTYSTPNVASLVQAIVNDDGWCGGNALGVTITGNNNRDAYTYRSSQVDAPALRVTYTMDGAKSGPNAGCQIMTTAAMLSENFDDAVEVPNGGLRPSWEGLSIPYNPKGKGRIGALRFDNINIPQDAEIVTAQLQLEHRDDVANGPLSFDISIEESDDAEPMRNGRSNEITGRSYSSGVPWSNVENGRAGRLALTPDLSSLVSDVVSRDGWKTGNAMLFKLQGTGSGKAYRTFVTRERDRSAAARLLITWRDYVGADGSTKLLARDEMLSEIAALKATGGTPVVDAMLEASNYYLGRPMLTGRTRGVDNQRHRYHRVSHRGSYLGSDPTRPAGCTADNIESTSCVAEQIHNDPVYIGQLEQSCQANSIVLLTDGEPTGSVKRTAIEGLIGESCDGPANSGQCSSELASYLAGNDLNADVAGEQKIRTHTVSFNLDKDPKKDTVLRSIAEAGDGTMFKAESTDELVKAFRTILTSVQSIDTAFTAPGATVNQYNRLTHRSDIYFALFKPDDQPRWDGNLKKYFVGREADGSGEIEIRGTDRQPVVDPDTGFFHDTARSNWAPENNGGAPVSPVDGKNVAMGGAAGQMEDIANRNVYTYLGASDAIPNGGIRLKGSPSNMLHEDNTGITAEMMNIMSTPLADREAYRRELLEWARGVDIDDEDSDGDKTDGRRFIGDPMHSRPVILNYASGKSIIYLSTNEGLLHAIDTGALPPDADGNEQAGENATAGEELFAFMPKHLLGNIDPFFINTASRSHPYGLDGTISVWRDDQDEDYVIDSNESAMLFLGMRRGGRNYYAFDVTDAEDPTLAWTIEGGIVGDDFHELGQSWSRATPARMRIGGVARDVLIFGGGYAPEKQDPNYGDLDQRSQEEDDYGRALFIVDAKTGDKLWSVGAPDATNVNTTFSDMTYSLPADVRVVDVDLDGFVDQLYTADMGGQVWRFDVAKQHVPGQALLEGGVLADLAGGNKTDHRRFYNEPDVALIEKDGGRFMAISVGSGWRAHPLDRTVQDRFYVIKSPFVRTSPGDGNYGLEKEDGSYRPIVESDLIDVAAATGIPETNEHGWFLDFATTGEKVLGKSITFDNSVVFTTYVPDAASASRPCEPSIGGGRAYILSAVNGYPTRDISGIDNSSEFDRRDQGDGTLDVKDRSINLMHGGIAPEPAVLITEEGEPLLLVGPEKIEAGFDNPTKRTFWADRGKAEIQGREETVAETNEN